MLTLEDYEDLWHQAMGKWEEILTYQKTHAPLMEDLKADLEEAKAMAFLALRNEGKGIKESEVLRETDPKVKKLTRDVARNTALTKIAQDRMKFYSAQVMGSLKWGKTREEEMKLQ